MATQYWAEGVWRGKWSHELKEAWMMRIREVQTWKQVRGPAGALMCETRDLGIKWPYWHTLISGNGYSEKHKSWRWQQKVSRATLPRTALQLWNAGKWRKCGWAVVQLDCDEELGLLHGMYFSTEAEFEVNRTIDSAELTLFLCFFRKVCGQRWKN